MVVQFFDFFVNRGQSFVGVGALAQQDNPFDHVVVVDDLSISAMDGRADLSQPNFGALSYGGDVFHMQHRSVLGGDGGVFDVGHAAVEADDAHINLLQSRFDEAAPGVGVVVCKLLFDLPDTQPVRHQGVGIDPHLVFAGGAAETGNVHDIRDRLKLFFELPVFDGFQFHQVVFGIGAF